MITNNEKKLYTIRQTCLLLSISVNTAKRLIAEKTLKTVNINKRGLKPSYRVTWESVNKFYNDPQP